MSETATKALEVEVSHLEEISQETNIPIWEIEHALGLLKYTCNGTSVKLAWETFQQSQLGTRERFIAKIVLNDLCLQKIPEANTFVDVLAIYKFSPPDSPSQIESFKKMLLLATTRKDLICLISKCTCLISEIRLLAIAKLANTHS
jgi:hypothetical protein